MAALLGIRTAPAHASTNSFCVQAANYNQCLNDWNNGGPSNSNEIRLYPINNPNENFVQQGLPGRCGGNVTLSCPFNKYFDKQYYSWPIVQLKYGSTGYCLATGSVAAGTNHVGVLGNCNNTTTGSGGSNGSVFVDHNGYIINVYWANNNGGSNNAACMEPIGSTGTSSFVDLAWPTGDQCAAPTLRLSGTPVVEVAERVRSTVYWVLVRHQLIERAEPQQARTMISDAGGMNVPDTADQRESITSLRPAG